MQITIHPNILSTVEPRNNGLFGGEGCLLNAKIRYLAKSAQ